MMSWPFYSSLPRIYMFSISDYFIVIFETGFLSHYIQNWSRTLNLFIITHFWLIVLHFQLQQYYLFHRNLKHSIAKKALFSLQYYVYKFCGIINYYNWRCKKFDSKYVIMSYFSTLCIYSNSTFKPIGGEWPWFFLILRYFI